MSGLKILGYGKHIPENIVTNDDLSKLVDTSDEWIVSRTGIKTRHFVTQETNAELATSAALQAIKDADISVDDISICIVATFSVDNLTPSIACDVCKNLSLKGDTVCFDLNAACSGFVYALNVAQRMLCADDKKCALVIGSEVLSRVTDMSDRNTCVLFGDGAGAVIAQKNIDNPFYFTGGCIPNKQVLFCDIHNKMIRMDGPSVFRFAVDIIPQTVTKILKENHLSLDDISQIVCHQANKRIIEFAAKRLNADCSKFFINLQNYGNTSAASIAIALKELPKKKGDKIICVGFGAGLTYGGVLLTI